MSDLERSVSGALNLSQTISDIKAGHCLCVSMAALGVNITASDARSLSDPNSPLGYMNNFDFIASKGLYLDEYVIFCSDGDPDPNDTELLSRILIDPDEHFNSSKVRRVSFNGFLVFIKTPNDEDWDHVIAVVNRERLAKDHRRLLKNRGLIPIVDTMYDENLHYVNPDNLARYLIGKTGDGLAIIVVPVYN